MEWTGAGVLPVTQREDGNDYLLLTRDPQSKRWGDLGGMRLGSESPLVTAARKASEESGKALGTHTSLYQRLSRLVQEKASVGPYRFFLCRFKADEVKDTVRTAQRGGRTLFWVPALELFQTIALHGLESPSRIRIQRKTVRRRLEQCIRHSTCYQAFLDRNPDLKAQAAVSMGKGGPIDHVCHRILPDAPGNTLVPLVVFRSISGKPGRCFAVRSMQGSPNEWVIKDYTQDFQPTYPQSIVERIILLFRCLFGLDRSEPNLIDRWAVIRAVKRRSLAHRAYRLLMQLKLQLGIFDANAWHKL